MSNFDDEKPLKNSTFRCKIIIHFYSNFISKNLYREIPRNKEIKKYKSKNGEKKYYLKLTIK